MTWLATWWIYFSFNNAEILYQLYAHKNWKNVQVADCTYFTSMLVGITTYKGIHTHTHTHTHIYTRIYQFSCSVMSNSLQPHEPQHARPPCPSPTPGAYPNSCPLSQWCHPAISSSVVPSPPALYLSQHHGLFKWVSSLHQVAKVLEFQLQHQSFQWTARTGLL